MLRITGDMPAILELAMETDSVDALQHMLRALWTRNVDLFIRDVRLDEPEVEAVTYFYRTDEFPDEIKVDNAYMIGGVNIERKGNGWTWTSRT